MSQTNWFSVPACLPPPDSRGLSGLSERPNGRPVHTAPRPLLLLQLRLLRRLAHKYRIHRAFAGKLANSGCRIYRSGRRVPGHTRRAVRDGSLRELIVYRTSVPWLIYAIGGGFGHLTRACALARAARATATPRILTNSAYTPIVRKAMPDVNIVAVDPAQT